MAQYKLEDVEHKDLEKRKKQFKVCLLLNALSTEYEHVVAYMQATSDLTYDEAIKRLRHEELRCENVQEQSYSKAISVTTNRTKKDTNKNAKNSNKNSNKQEKTCECYCCGKVGHIKKDCSIWKWQQKEKNGESNDNTNASNKASTAYNLKQLNRLIDSEAGNYVTSLKGHFRNYRTIHRHQLEVANGQQLTVIGIGDIELLESQLEDKGITMAIQPNGSRILARNSKPVTSVHRIGQLYTLRSYIEAQQQPVALYAELELKLKLKPKLELELKSELTAYRS
ncbi:MAG: hypothetical protein M1813_003520 [Trichoglossum hirsutum]|nr:MAG: hypothetical protein M1813_003520 [Trichoglossum hirsutum]